MAHLRERHLTPFLKKCLAFSPIVGLVGHRQVGKTTLLGLLGKGYFSLDDEESAPYLAESAQSFIEDVAGVMPLALDEAQLMPELFPALKNWVRRHPKPGQFLLSGSIRFTSLKSVRESLTGRIVTRELLPLSINELLAIAPPSYLASIHRREDFGKPSNPDLAITPAKARAAIESYAVTGGLPGLCFVRDQRLKNGRLKTQLDTLLDRDLRLIHPTRLAFSELQEIFGRLALLQGEPFSASQITGKRMNSSSTQALLDGFEGLFLIRRVLVEGDRRGSAVFFEDLAEHRYVAELMGAEVEPRTHLLFSLARAALASTDVEASFFQFRTRSGSCVPLAIRSAGAITGLLPIDGDKPNRSESAAAKAFLGTYARAKVVFVSDAALSEIDARRTILPLWAFLA